MEQLKRLYGSLSLKQKIGIVAMLLVIGAGVSGLMHWNREHGFRPLFTGMAPEDAAAIVQKLKESGVDHRIADNGTVVLVPEAQVDELRLEMAGAGLPKTGRVGFEIFDKTNLGITDFTEHVNYRRALEGELERSIKALTEVEQARVHVTFPKESVFVDSREPAKASVLIRLRPGAHLNPQNVLAVTNLIASAVEGLSPDYVSVLDMQGNLLSRPHKPGLDGTETSEAALDYKHQVEKDLVAKVESTLEPLLGEGKFRVGVSADCDFTTTDQSDETFDPTRSVMVTSQKSEDVSGATQTSGVPGTASNLPRSVPAKPAGSAGVSRRTENIAYETTRSVKHVKIPQGAIKRISASLLIDNEVQWQGKGKQMKRILVPPSTEKLKAIHDVVAGVLGIVPDRGDQLVIESLAFEQTAAADQMPEGAASPISAPVVGINGLFKDKRVLIGAGSVAVLLVGGAAFVFFRRKPKRVQVEDTSAGAIAAGHPSASELSKNLPNAISGSVAIPVESFAADLPPLTRKVELMREHVKDQVRKDPAVLANVLRNWLDEDGR